jgi:cold-inducible RNA-binding protein
MSLGTKRKLYVGNFPYSTTMEQLRELFEGVGAVRAVRIITFSNSGKSRGFAFVEMQTPREAAEALKTLDGHMFEGRTLRIGYAEPKKPVDVSQEPEQDIVR